LVESVGAYYYYSLVLACFDPVKAKAIFDQEAHEIAEAFVSKMAYEYVEPDRR